MAKLFIVVISALAATIVSAQTGLSCNMNQEEVKKAVMECVAHEPILMFQVIEHMNNPESMATTNFICQNQNEVVDLFVCLEDKFVACFGSAMDNIKQYLPSRDRWAEALKFMCDHKSDIVETNCMDQNQLQEFMQCYMGKVAILLQPSSIDDMKTSLCSIIHSEEQCIQEHHGKCNGKYISLLIQFLDKLFPFCPVLTIDMKNQALNDAMGSVLVQGQPLKFQPNGNVPYTVVKG